MSILPEHIIQDAAHWYAELLDDGTPPERQEQWQIWLAADPLHQAAWARIEQVRLRFQAVPAQVAYPTLNAHQSKRRLVLRSIMGVTGGACITGAAYRYLPWQAWQADYATGVGDYAQYYLSDGSELHLNSRSAIDTYINTKQRLLVLHQGEVLLETHSNPLNDQPLTLRTPHGQVRTHSARFIVQLYHDHTQIKVLKDKLWVGTHTEPNLLHPLQAGQMLRFGTTHIHPVQTLPQGVDAWLQGNYRALDIPLGELLHELSRHHRGYLGCDDELRQLKVSGVFPLHNLAQSLAVLCAAFSLRQSGLGLYWIQLHSANT